MEDNLPLIFGLGILAYLLTSQQASAGMQSITSRYPTYAAPSRSGFASPAYGTAYRMPATQSDTLAAKLATGALTSVAGGSAGKAIGKAVSDWGAAGSTAGGAVEMGTTGGAMMDYGAGDVAVADAAASSAATDAAATAAAEDWSWSEAASSVAAFFGF